MLHYKHLLKRKYKIFRANSCFLKLLFIRGHMLIKPINSLKL